MRTFTKPFVALSVTAFLSIPLAFGQADQRTDTQPKIVGGVILAIGEAGTRTEPKAGGVGKVPWLWSDDERIAIRFDPKSIAARNEAYRLTQPAARGTA